MVVSPPKVFATFNTQISILKSRGLKVSRKTKTILMTENYYNVINGYKALFIDPQSVGNAERYRPGTHFNELYALYLFDRELRNIFLRRLLKIETHIKTKVAYEFSRQHGGGEATYTTAQNFQTVNRKGQKKFNEFLNGIKETLTRQSDLHDAVRHYREEYNDVPLWVLVNVMEFGRISKFYSNMQLAERQAIAKEYGIHEDEMRACLKYMSRFRNICAHEDKLFDKIQDDRTKIPSNRYHAALKIPKDKTGTYCYGIKDVFALLICLKIFLPENKKRGEFSSTVKEIDNALERLNKKLKTITIDKVTEKMGFPKNWHNL